MVAIQLGQFIVQHQDDLQVTILRSLCKHLGEAGLELEREANRDLRTLMELLEELATLVTDDNCLASIEVSSVSFFQASSKPASLMCTR